MSVFIGPALALTFVLCVLCVLTRPAGAATPPADTASALPVPDLDLGMELEDERPATGADPGSPRSSRAWIYWASAGTAVAVSGLGWFWYASGTREVRNEQVFTDER